MNAASLLLLPAGWTLLFAAGMSRRVPSPLLSALAVFCCLAPVPGILVCDPAAPLLSLWNGGFVWDPTARLLSLVILAGTAFGIALAARAPSAQALPGLPFPLLAVTAAGGAVAAVAARDLAATFVALEIVSMAGYALAGLPGGSRRAAEASMKYFLFGAAATGLLAFGLALLYAGSGSTLPPAVPTPFARAGALLFLAGLLVKAGAAPFHLWAPDAYAGASLPAAALLSTVSKVAAIGAVVRFAASAAPLAPGLWEGLLWGAAALTMTAGNLGALRQTDLRRLLAYSSVAHTGYLLMGTLVAASTGAPSATVPLYLAAYTGMGLATFGFLGLRRSSDTGEAALAGLARRRPFLAAVLAAGLLSLAGIPPTAGFAAKFGLFAEAARAGYWGLLLVAVANTLLSLYYYLRALGWIYLQKGAEEDLDEGRLVSPSTVALGLVLGAILAAGTLLPLAGRLF